MPPAYRTMTAWRDRPSSAPAPPRPLSSSAAGPASLPTLCPPPPRSSTATPTQIWRRRVSSSSTAEILRRERILRARVLLDSGGSPGSSSLLDRGGKQAAGVCLELPDGASLPSLPWRRLPPFSFSAAREKAVVGRRARGCARGDDSIPPYIRWE
ncbi:hypothetical protein PR202_ga19816 [Eleusine coracana subsp. coracana]|uniref:Uncharacterized protein n=1 Tax=Eleusine coracana subsp. coracana TaxID=191504 RepID=A0AAV5CWK2_ELECO|nr:hypothetical protein PR202_ga19816 [Eleusine coracana subsp. coracana]